VIPGVLTPPLELPHVAQLPESSISARPTDTKAI
jgi:hypothetical protein